MTPNKQQFDLRWLSAHGVRVADPRYRAAQARATEEAWVGLREREAALAAYFKGASA